MMLNNEQINNYLYCLQSQLLDNKNFISILLSRSWARQAPDEAGVYALKENDQVIYVGETGNLRGRMIDLLDSRNHILRRTIGSTYYSDHPEFKVATASSKFPEAIEQLVNDHICFRLKVSYLAVSLGRKELEELIQATIPTGTGLNKRGRRITR